MLNLNLIKPFPNNLDQGFATRVGPGELLLQGVGGRDQDLEFGQVLGDSVLDMRTPTPPQETWLGAVSQLLEAGGGAVQLFLQFAINAPDTSELSPGALRGGGGARCPKSWPLPSVAL